MVYYLLFPYSLCRCRFANIIQYRAVEGEKDGRKKVTKLSYYCLLVQQFRASFFLTVDIKTFAWNSSFKPEVSGFGVIPLRKKQ